MNKEFPDKWKETIDPFKLDLKNIKITSILGYPHAANQVFIIKGIRNNIESRYVLKYTGHIDSNIENEVKNLSLLKLNILPKVVEKDDNNKYRITTFLEGKKLSEILDNNESLSYMYDFGKMLAIIHTQTGCFSNAPIRRFHNIPDKEYFDAINLEKVYYYLINNKPNEINYCFIHGDFHYANVLWKDHKISGVLDFELSGIGNKEFDIAWSLILRPGQEFMKTKIELEEYIKGYQSINRCDKTLIKYYMALIYSRFINFGDDTYKTYIRKWFDLNC